MDLQEILRKTAERTGKGQNAQPVLQKTGTQPGQQIKGKVDKKSADGLSIEEILEKTKRRKEEEARRLKEQEQTPAQTPETQSIWDKFSAFLSRGKYHPPQFKQKQAEGLVANVGQFDITEEDVKNNPNLLPLYKDINKTTTVLPGPRREGQGGALDIPENERYTTSLDVREVSKREGLKAFNVVNDNKKSEILPTAPLTTKVSRNAQDMITDLRYIDAQFKQTQGVLNRYKLIDKQVIQPFMQGGSQSLARNVSHFAKTGEVILDILNPFINNKVERDRRYNAINNAITNVYPSKKEQNLFYKIGSFVPDLVMFVAADHGITKLFGALPQALRSQKLIQELAEAMSWVGVGQVVHREDQGPRGLQALYDGISYGLFRGLLGVRAVTGDLINNATRGIPDNIKNKLSETAQDIITKVEEGKPVLVDEVEYVVKEISEKDTPGGVKWRGLDIETNSQQQLINLVPNMNKVNYEINPNVARPTIQFPTSPSQSRNGIRVIARNEDELADLSRAIGGDLTNKVTRLADDVLSGVFRGNWANIRQEVLSALVSNAVRNGNLTAKAINESVEKFLNNFTELARKASNELPPRLKKIAPIGSFDDNPNDYMELIAKAILETDTYKSAAFRSKNSELTRFIQSLGDIKPSKIPSKIKKTPEISSETKIKTANIPQTQEISKYNGGTLKGDISARQPIKTSGKKIRESALFNRLKKTLGDQMNANGLEYTQANLDEIAQNAIKTVQSNNPNDILNIVRGVSNKNMGTTDLRLGIALFEDAVAKGDYSLATDAIVATARRATREGQEIASLRGQIGGDNPMAYIQEIIKRRTEALARLDNIKMSDFFRSSQVSRGRKKISNQAKELMSDIKIRSARIKDAQKILDELTCK